MKDNISKGYVSIFRSFLDWEWFTEPNMVTVFIYCLLKANYRDNRWRGIDIKKGSFITSYNTISVDTGLSVQKVRTCLKKLINTGELTIYPTNKNTMVTVVKYEAYQESNQQINKQDNNEVTINQQTTNKQLTTTNNYNNYNKQQQDENSGVDIFEVYKNQIAEEMKNPTEWRNSFYRLYNLKDNSLSKVMDDFILQRKSFPDNPPKNLSEFKRHFSNWCIKVDPIGKLNSYKKHQPKEKGSL